MDKSKFPKADLSARTNNKDIKVSRGESKMVKCPKCQEEMEHMEADWAITESDFTKAYIHVQRQWHCKRCGSMFIEKFDKQVDI